MTLTIGPSHKRFIVHKRLICEKSDFFHKAFMSGFIEGEEGKMDMPEDSEGAISLFLGWLYRDELRTGHSQSALDNLLDLYFFGENICLTYLIDLTMDEIQTIYKDHQLFMTEKTIDKVYQHTSQSSKLRSFCIDLMVFQYTNDGSDDGDPLPYNQTPALSYDQLKAIWKLSAKNVDIYFDYFQRIGQFGVASEENKLKFVLKDRRDDLGNGLCHYHCHTKEDPCFYAKPDASETADAGDWLDDTV